MGRSQDSFRKKEVKKKQEKKRMDKEKKKLARKDNEKRDFDSMLAYVDENGMIVSTPPDPDKKIEIKLEDIKTSVPPRENIDKNEKRTCVVSFFNDSKGYGFIRDSETRESIFVHANNLNTAIKEGNRVSFETEMGKKGLAAVHVELLK